MKFLVALALVCGGHLWGQNVGPISSGRLAWYDYSCKCPTGQLTCATCWKYLRLPAGAKIEPDPSGASDGILWPVEMLAAPGTNQHADPVALPQFNPEDFSSANGTVSVRWPIPIEGGLAAGESYFGLLGFTAEPLGCTVYRDGLRLSWAFHDFEIVAPAQASGEWRLWFPPNLDRGVFISAHCLKGD